MTYIEREFDIHTDDPRVDDLARELVSLKPDWQSANPDQERSRAILQELDTLGLNPWQKKQVEGYVAFHWTVAAGRARQLGLSGNAPHNAPLSQTLAGICLVQSDLERAQKFNEELAL